VPSYIAPERGANGLRNGENQKLFENSGMEIYETIGIVLVPQEEEHPGPNRATVQSLLYLREMQEEQFQQLHAVHEVLHMRRVRRLIIDDWMQQISQALQPSINVRPEDIVNRHRPWEI